jgi:hypothetical protein
MQVLMSNRMDKVKVLKQGVMELQCAENVYYLF